MKQLIIVAVALGFGTAHASEANYSSQKLLGWSEDGTTWAVISQGGQEMTTLDVYKSGGIRRHS